MKLGIELDRIIAEKVMGAIIKESAFGGEPHCDYQNRKTGHEFGKLSQFSTEIAAAWEVVNKLVSQEYIVDISSYPESKQWLKCPSPDTPSKDWILENTKQHERFHCSVYIKMDGEWFLHTEASAETAPMAICLAALQTVES